MAHGLRSVLHRALDDLGEGIRSLFALDESRPSLVRELLDARGPRRTRRAARRDARRSRGKALVRIK